MGRSRAIAPAASFIILFGALAAGSFFLIQKESQQIEGALIASRAQAASTSAATLSAFLSQAKTHSAAVAQAFEPWSGSPKQAAQARAPMDAAIAYSPVFDAGMYIVTLEGRVISTSSSVAALSSLSRPSNFLVSAARQTVATPVFQDPLIKVPVIAAASPLRDGAGQITGILVAMVDAKRFAPTLDGLRFGQSVQTFIVDPAGQVLDLRAHEAVDKSNRTVEVPLKGAASSPTGSVRYEGPGGIDAVAAWATSVDGWRVILHQEAKELLGGTQDPLRMAAVALGVMALAGAAVALLLIVWVRKAAGDSDRVKRAFLAIAGHELRTPLTSIRGFSQTMERRWEKLTNEQRKQMLSTIARQARNLENLVERLLLGAQLEGGIKQSPALREGDVTEAIQKAVEHQRAQAPLHQFELDLESPLPAKVDSKGLNQVLTQLLENAIKYSPAGGTVWVRTRKTSAGVEVTVEDEGVGLPSDISGIFDKFGQGESVDTRVHDEGGVGLGLFIAKRHLEMMNGTIKAERRKAGGASFVIRLPA